MGLFFRDKAGVETPVVPETLADEESSTPPKTQPVAIAPDPRVAQLEAELSAKEKRLADLETQTKAMEAARTAERIATIKADGKAFAQGLVTSRKLMPAGAEAMANLHAFAALAAAGLPVDGIDASASIQGLASGLVSHNLTSEAVANTNVGNVLRLQNGSQGSEEASDEEVIARLKKRSNGAAAIAYAKQHGLLG